jgi:CRISPR-associated endonuclease Csn1
MKKILGLDLGSSSIGWAFIKATDDGEPEELVNMGVRIVPLTVDEKGEFEAGNTITKNRDRTLKRTMRKGFDRYQSRRKNLETELTALGMMPDNALLKHTDSVTLYGLYNNGLTGQITLQQLGRLLWHLNQKRGYKSMRGSQAESEGDKKVTDYEREINDRYGHIKQLGITVGQYFYQKLLQNQFARLKQQVFPRHAYIEQYDAIMKAQQSYYPSVITDDVINKLRDNIIYYQRPLKSQKGLVNVCEFEGKKHVDPVTGKVTLIGPKVAPRSSPLFAVCRIWENINSIALEDKYKNKRQLTLEEKQKLFEKLNDAEKVTEAELFKLLGAKKSDYITDKQTNKRGIQGNITKHNISQVFADSGIYDKWLQFDLKIVDKVNEKTGEIITEISPDFEQQPLYRLWHLLYSIKEKEVLQRKLMADFGFDEETAKQLIKLDFTKAGFGNKSARNMRKILPGLMQGNVYSDAMQIAGTNHSGSKTKQQAALINTIDKLAAIDKNSLRQPVVEKILNQLVNVVNAIIDDSKMGKPDEIRIELARELKQSREERNKTYSNNNKRDRENKDIAKLLLEQHPPIKPSRKNIERYRLWKEFDCISAYGPYNPSNTVSIAQAFNGNYDIDHIIPQSRMFDDSFANKVFCSRKQNADKGFQTAYDYMHSLGDEALHSYLSKVEELYKNDKISRTKRDRLLTGAAEIPKEFINRQLNETRYIVRKAKEILAPLLKEKEHNIISTSGSVTAFLRHNWGWDDVLVNLNYDKYPEDKKRIEQEINGRHRKVIDGWSKRDDHRHHAIDALTIACTSRSVIKRMNDLNQLLGKETASDEGLKTFVKKIKTFSTKQIEEQASKILVSLKPGKKVASKSKNKANGQITYAPRGPLSEETVYGCINVKDQKHYVVKYKLDTNLKVNDLEYIVDGGIKRALEKRLAEYNNDPKRAFKELEAKPVFQNAAQNIPIKSIRMFTNISSTEAVKYNEEGEPIGFVKPGNNHHIAIYENEKGKRFEKVVTFWEAVARRAQGLPVIDSDPIDGSKFITSLQQNEMFVFNLTKEQLEHSISNNEYSLISKNLFRVRKLTAGSYWFNHHLETQPRESVDDKRAGRCIQASVSGMKGLKVRVNHLGIITKIGE